MNKIILAPDSFKGTLSSAGVCKIMKEEINRVWPDCQVVSLPVADGGEGTCSCFVEALGGETHALPVRGPYFESVRAEYCIINDGKTAVIEMASAAGLPLVKDNKNPMLTTTYGVGELVRDALSRGVSEIILGLGGSATNDGGAGMASALGALFFEETGKSFIPVGGTLKNVTSIDFRETHRLLSGVRLRVMCDVSTPLCGPLGAAAVFGPQKGANETMVVELEAGLAHLGSLFAEIPGKDDVLTLPGSGAAGGLGAGTYALMNGALESGIEIVLDTVRFDSLLEGCGLVFTGEGRIDGQSLYGKVISGIVRRAKPKNVPVCAVVGSALDDQIQDAWSLGLSAVFPIGRRPLAFEEAGPQSEDFLRHTMRNLLQLLNAVGR